MVDVRTCAPIAPADLSVVRAAADAAEAVDGHPSLGDGVWRDLAAPSPTSTLLVAEVDGTAAGALHLTARPDGAFTAAVVVHPDHREAGVASKLVGVAVEAVSARGGGHLAIWAFGTDERADAFASSSGFIRERELWQMRVPLPLAEQPRWPTNVEVRSFVPGRDEHQWVLVNNRAFAHDPDQGRWSEDDLRRLEAEPWFDAKGFLVAATADGFAGFCWTKLHPAVPPHEPDVLGEIFVIGVDPSHQGTGLGRALVLGGLASLHERGAPVGMLFVDAENAPAIGLYRDLGFSVARVDRAYGQDVQ
ncbi:MAG: mycothiol synthase [Acidimicrobiia bacterium]